MRRVFIVVGHSESRKSSTIRALTGASKPRVVQVRPTNNESFDIFVFHASLQEKGIAPDDFVAQVEKLADNPDVLVAVRTKPSRNQRLPDGQGYALRFEQAGWQIAGVATLHGGPFGPLTDNAPQPIPIPDSQNMPVNEIANTIRGVWNWL